MPLSLTQKRAVAQEISRRKIDRYSTPDPRCGTVAGYFAHRRRKPKERPCLACRVAWRDYNRELRKKRKESK